MPNFFSVLAGSILLNIHEVWPRPFWGGSSHQNKTSVDHFIGHIPFASLEGDKSLFCTVGTGEIFSGKPPATPIELPVISLSTLVPIYLDRTGRKYIEILQCYIEASPVIITRIFNIHTLAGFNLF